MFRILPSDRVKHPLDSHWRLNQQEVKSLHEQYGANEIIDRTARPFIAILKDTLLDPMIWFLFGASVMFILLGKYPDAMVLLLAIIPIGGMDAFLHWRTQFSTRALSSKLIHFAYVLRANAEYQLPAKELVPGDLVLVKAGEYFPADGIILTAENAQVDESSLTGETFAVTKSPLTKLPKETSLVSYDHWGFVGTRLLTGNILLRVIYTGQETLYGEIISSVLRSQHERTPLQKAISRLVYTLLWLAIIFCGILAFVRFYQGFGVIDALLSAATLAVAALPDEFPMVFTFFLGVGIYRLAKNHALVRRGVSVENIGRITCICTDKTGTITQGLFKIACYECKAPVTPYLLSLTAAMASRPESGDPLDIAILTEAHAQGFTLPERLHVYPFSEDRKREASIYRQEQQMMAACKGAPEDIFQLSLLDAAEKLLWRQKVIALAEQGYKVIACAAFTFKPDEKHFYEPEKGYQFQGLLAFIDPPRPEVYAAVNYCRQSNIHILMITGDHPATSKKIASEIGLGNGIPNVILAQEAEAFLQQGNREFLRHVDVIARAVPSQKYALVKALREDGNIVAVTGDGVNDVPALRIADVGIAMGERGTQSAREAAAIVLLDDNFGSIVNAINEGQQLFRNMQQSFKYLLLIHIPYVISATIIPLLGFPLLYYPIHIVWIELFIHPTCILAFQYLPNQSPTKSMNNDRKRQVAFFKPMDWWAIALIGSFTTLFVIVLYMVSLWLTRDAASARANAFSAVGLIHVGLLIGLSKLQTLSARLIALFSIIMLLFLVEIPVIAHYFNMEPPSIYIWLITSLFACLTGFLAYKWR